MNTIAVHDTNGGHVVTRDTDGTEFTAESAAKFASERNEALIPELKGSWVVVELVPVGDTVSMIADALNDFIYQRNTASGQGR